MRELAVTELAAAFLGKSAADLEIGFSANRGLVQVLLNLEITLFLLKSTLGHPLLNPSPLIPHLTTQLIPVYESAFISETALACLLELPADLAVLIGHGSGFRDVVLAGHVGLLR